MSALQDLGSRGRTFTASHGFPTTGTHRRRLITYFRLAAKWLDSAEFIAVLMLTLTIFLCWRLWSLSLRDRFSLRASTSSQTCHLFQILKWVGSIYAANVSLKLKATSLEDQILETMWGHYKVLSILLQEVLGKRMCAKKPWISQATLAIIDQRRQAIRRG